MQLRAFSRAKSARTRSSRRAISAISCPVLRQRTAKQIRQWWISLPSAGPRSVSLTGMRSASSSFTIKEVQRTSTPFTVRIAVTRLILNSVRRRSGMWLPTKCLPLNCQGECQTTSATQRHSPSLVPNTPNHDLCFLTVTKPGANGLGCCQSRAAFLCRTPFH